MKLIKAEVFNLYSYLYLPVNDLISSGCLHPLLAASRAGRGIRDGPITKKTALLLLLDQPSPARPWPATRQRKKWTSVTKLKGTMLFWSPSDPRRGSAEYCGVPLPVEICATSTGPQVQGLPEPAVGEC